MKKKNIALIAALTICISIFGCSSNTSNISKTGSARQTDAQMWEISENAYSVEYLPLTLQYGSGEIVFEQFEAVNTEYGYDNGVSAALVFDLSSLSDEERYYLIEIADSDLETSVLVSNGKEGEDSHSNSLSLIDKKYKDGKYYVIYGNHFKMELERDSLEGRDVTAFVELRQDEESDRVHYLYKTTVSASKSKTESNESETDISK